MLQTSKARLVLLVVNSIKLLLTAFKLKITIRGSFIISLYLFLNIFVLTIWKEATNELPEDWVC